MKIKIACISDTHKMHKQWHENLIYDHWGWEVNQEWNDCDILLHAGDVSSYGYKHEVQQFCKWFSSLPQIHKIFIAGNHDFFFDTNYRTYTETGKRRHHHKSTDQRDIDELLAQYSNITYLNEESTESFGLKIYGTPIQPWFHDWAFNRMRGDDIKPHWDRIPDDTDVLVVHGPPHGILDLLHPNFRDFNENPNVGCEDLLKRIKEIKPKLVVFGHIHEGYGIYSKQEDMKKYYKLLEKQQNAKTRLEIVHEDRIKESIQENIELLQKHIDEFNSTQDDTIFVNASCLDESYRPVNKPIFIELEL